MVDVKVGDYHYEVTVTKKRIVGSRLQTTLDGSDVLEYGLEDGSVVSKDKLVTTIPDAVRKANRIIREIR